MSKLINLAIIGGSCSSTIGKTHIKSIKLTGKYNIHCGFFSRNKSENYKSGIQYNVPKNKIYHNLSDLIEKEKQNIDMAVVLTPPNARYKIFEMLSNNNINIISEKPFSDDLNSAKKIFKIIKNKKIFFGTTYNYLGYPSIMEIKPLIKKIGKILNFVFEMPQQSFVYKRSKTKNWRLKDGKIPNLYLDLASHLLSFTYYFFDDYPKEIKNFSSKHDKFKAVDNCYTWLKFRNFYGSFWFSKNSSGQRNQLSIRIFGTKGAIKWEHSKPESLIFFDNDGNIKMIDRLNKNSQYINNNQFHTYAAGHPNGFLDAFANIYLSISKLFLSKKRKRNVPLILNLKENFNIMSILNAMNTASKKNNWIKTFII